MKRSPFNTLLLLPPMAKSNLAEWFSAGHGTSYARSLTTADGLRQHVMVIQNIFGAISYQDFSTRFYIVLFPLNISDLKCKVTLRQSLFCFGKIKRIIVLLKKNAVLSLGASLFSILKRLMARLRRVFQALIIDF